MKFKAFSWRLTSLHGVKHFLCWMLLDNTTFIYSVLKYLNFQYWSRSTDTIATWSLMKLKPPWTITSHNTKETFSNIIIKKRHFTAVEGLVFFFFFNGLKYLPSFKKLVILSFYLCTIHATQQFVCICSMSKLPTVSSYNLLQNLLSEFTTFVNQQQVSDSGILLLQLQTCILLLLLIPCTLTGVI